MGRILQRRPRADQVRDVSQGTETAPIFNYKVSISSVVQVAAKIVNDRSDFR